MRLNSRTSCLISTMFFLFVLGSWNVFAKTKKDFAVAIEKKNCQEAENIFASLSFPDDSSKIPFLLKVARCYNKDKYQSYKAQQIYTSILSIKPTGLVQVEVLLGKASALAKQIYSYRSSYYARKREAFVADMEKIKSMMDKLGLANHADFRAEYFGVWARYYVRLGDYRTAFYSVQKIENGSFSEKNKAIAMFYISEKILISYGTWSMSSNNVTRRKKYYEKMLTVFQEKKHLAKAYYHLGLLVYGHSPEEPFEKILSYFRKAFYLKAGKFSKLAETQLLAITSPQIGMSLPLQIEPNKKWSSFLQLLKIKKVTLKVFPFDLPHWFQKHKQMHDFSKVVLTKSLHEQTLMLSAQQKINWSRPQHYSVPVQLSLKPGTYLVEARGINRFKQETILRVPLLVSHAKMITKTSSNQLLVFLTDGQTGKALPGAKLVAGIAQSHNYYGYSGYYGKRYRRHHRGYRRPSYPSYGNSSFVKANSILHGFTDKKGLFSANLPNNKQRYVIRIIACLGDICSINQGNSAYYYSYGVKHKLYFTTDRGAYRPGQVVHFKGIYRMKDDDGLHNLAFSKVRVRANDSKGNKLFEKEWPLTEYGTFNHSFSLSKDASLGKYTLHTYIVGRSKSSYSSYHSSSFQVEEYRRPKFQVSAKLINKGALKNGDRLKWKIKANYTFGGPVRKGKVEWELFTEQAHPLFSFPRDYEWYFPTSSHPYRYNYYHRYNNNQYYLDYYKRLADQYQRLMVKYPHYRYYRRYYKQYHQHYLNYKRKIKPFAFGTGTLNSKGELQVSTKSFEGNAYSKYKMKVKVTDLSRRMIPGTGTTVLGKEPAKVYLRTTKQIVLPGEKIEAHIRTLRGSSTGVSLAGHLELHRMSKDGTLETEVLKSIPVTTDTFGKAIVRFEADYLGHFGIRYVAKLKNGFVVEGKSAIWLGSEQLQHTEYNYKDIEVVTDRDLYFPKQKMALLINTKHKADSFLVAVENERIHWANVFPRKGNSTVIDFSALPSFSPNAWVSVSFIFGGKLYTTSQRIVVPPTHQFLKVVLQPLKKTYLPGEKTKWSLMALNHKGKPVQSEFLLFAYDQSLDLIGKVDFPDIRKSFYGDQKYLRTTTQTYLPQPFRRSITTQNLLGQNQSIFGTRNGFSGRGKGGGGISTGTLSLGKSSPKKKSRRSAKREMPSPSVNEKMKEESKSDKSISDGDSPSAGKDANDVKPGTKRQQPPRVRKNFQETAIWLADTKTDAKGLARVEFRWPDSLTRWTIRAVAISKKTQIASSEFSTRTNKPIMVQMAAPRYFMIGDTATIAVMIFNRKKDRKIKVAFNAEGLEIIHSEKEQEISLLAGENKKILFQVKATQPGKVKLFASVVSEEASDAVELKKEVLPFGLDHYKHSSGLIAEGQKKGLTIALPKEFSKGSGEYTLSMTSSLTRSIFDSLGYLVQFPYGCVEQTMSRFLPAALVAKTMEGLDKTDPALAKKLPKVIEKGLNRLYGFQHIDGGWGWWNYDKTNDWMTAYVLFGLATAKSAGFAINEVILQKGTRYLLGQMKKLRSTPSTHAYALYSLSLVGSMPAAEVDHSFEHLKKLNAYSLALLSMAFHQSKNLKNRDYVLEQLAQKIDNVQAGDEAYFPGKGSLRGWSEDGLEATAVALRALVVAKKNPEHWPKLAKWLMNQRRGKQWRSTRDTAQVILSLSKYATAIGENTGYRKLEIWAGGKKIHAQTLDVKDPLQAGLTWKFSDAELRKNIKNLQVKNVGNGPLYFAASLHYKTKETVIAEGGSGILSIQRKYYRVLKQGRKVSFKEIQSNEPVKAGTEVEVRLRIQSNNLLKYLLFEDRKPAGLEPLEIKSGKKGYGWLSHREFRDTKVAFFAQRLSPKVIKYVTYRVLAERPGVYQTLPAIGLPMYAPKANGHSSSFIFHITP